MIKRVNRRQALQGAGAVTAAAILGRGVRPAKAAELELVKPGVLTVAYNGEMPGTGAKDGKLIGLDGEIMQWVGEQLGLTVEPVLMEWAAEIESVKSRRVDAMHGMMGWNEPRTKVINITDPIYYGGANITQKKETSWSSVKDLEGKTIATIQGFGWIEQLKAIAGSDLKLYETSDAAMRDMLAGASMRSSPIRRWCNIRSRRIPTGRSMRFRSTRPSIRNIRRSPASTTSSSASPRKRRTCSRR
jgi:ABC-type amino acid transport substrate-binding protein